MDYCLVVAAFQKAELHGKGLVPAALFGPQPFFLENEVEWGRSDPSNLLLPVVFITQSIHWTLIAFSSAPSSLHFRYYCTLYYSQVLINGCLLFLIS